MKQKFIDYFMDLAQRTSEMSCAKRLKVGGIAVKNKRIIATGWNGTPEGWDNECEDENNITKPEVIHAEENLLCQLASGTESARGADIFLTHSPCRSCSKLIAQVGIKTVYYRIAYRDPTAINTLEKSGVRVVQC